MNNFVAIDSNALSYLVDAIAPGCNPTQEAAQKRRARRSRTLSNILRRRGSRAAARAVGRHSGEPFRDSEAASHALPRPRSAVHGA
jgi:hypothetical protein